jgi:hypothetical protein
LDVEGYAWRIRPEENPDWGYARNRQILLKTPMAEYSASAFTAPITISDKIFCGGNRDYPWQGLILGPWRGSSYKVLDAVYFSFPDLTLRPLDVAFKPDRCIYRYECGEGRVAVSFTLRDIVDRVLLSVEAGRECWFIPLLDSTPLELWSSSDYQSILRGSQLILKPSAIPFRIIIEGFKEFKPLNLELEWRYKLGDGFRRWENGFIRFIERRRRLFIPCMVYSPKGSLRVEFPIPKDMPYTLERPEVRGRLRLGKGLIAEAIYLRFETLSSYSTFLDDTWFPEAGSWWFRKPWVRDALEGIRWNMRTYLQLFGWRDKLLTLMGRLLETMEEAGGLPIIAGATGPFSSDAPPQLLYVASLLSEMTNDRGLSFRVIEAAEQLSERLLKGLPVSSTLLTRDILCSPASSSWMDSVITIGDVPWPTRLPREWIKYDVKPFSPSFGLVEVNALYIGALEEVKSTCRRLNVEVPKGVEELSRILKEGFTRNFNGSGGLPPLTVVPSMGLVDPTIGSPSVVAVAVLRDILYTEEELRRLFPIIAERLLVHRSLILLGRGKHPFGILARDIERTPYLGDEEYHGATVWPRDTPYLIKLLEEAGEDIHGLLLTNLDHMVSEAAIGYCSELFSLPVGGNPSPGPEAENPVPVKNPAQYWSHWCDPYLEHSLELVKKSFP